MRIVVTGGRGFIGSRLVPMLSERGHGVRVADLSDEPALSVSVLDPARLASALVDADAVIHLAGPVRESMLREPVAGMRLQVSGTRNVLTACVANSVPWVILASSFYVYACTAAPRVTEETAPWVTGLDRFGMAKIASERLCHRFAAGSRLDYTICRFGSAYGDGGSNAVRGFIEAGLAGGPITVWGRGQRRNQYTYVMDIATALANLLERRATARQRTYNIVSPTVTTTAELARLIADAVGCDLRFLADRPEGPSLAYVDSTVSRDQLGWSPTDLAEGVGATLAAMRRRLQTA